MAGKDLARMGLVLGIKSKEDCTTGRVMKLGSTVITQPLMTSSKTGDEKQRRKGANMRRDFRNRPGVIKAKYAICQPRFYSSRWDGGGKGKTVGWPIEVNLKSEQSEA